MNKTPQCGKCGGEMQEGFVADQGHDRTYVSTWVSGRPETSFWGNLKVKGRAMYQLQTFRCNQCGFLESYATVP